MKFPAPPFNVRAACLFIACLRPHEDGADTFEMAPAMVRVKPQGTDQRIGAVADLAERDQRVFPPAAAGSGGLGRDDSPG